MWPVNEKHHPTGGAFSFVEQDTGVEPAFTAWEAVVLPIYESCVSFNDGNYSRPGRKIQPLFVDGM